MVSPQASTFASVVLIAVTLAALVRLAGLQLASAYPSLVFFYSCELAIVAAPEILGVTTSLYAYAFVVLVPLEWFAFGVVLRELYGSVFAKYPGIKTMGRWSVYAALTITFVVAGVVSAGHSIAERQTATVALEFASACIIVGSAVLVGFILHIISQYRIELHKNVVTNCRFFALYMAADACMLLASGFLHVKHLATVGFAGMLASALILASWSLSLSREGEVTTMTGPSGSRNPAEEARLLCQLNAFNNFLLRVARK